MIEEGTRISVQVRREHRRLGTVTTLNAHKEAFVVLDGDTVGKWYPIGVLRVEKQLKRKQVKRPDAADIQQHLPGP